MRSLMIGEGWSNNPWVIPTVEHPKHILDPDNFGSIVIYVGKDREWPLSSPWVNPCDNGPIPEPHGGILNFAKYWFYRADINDVLEPLFGCHLICDCQLDQNHCHAHHLENLCCQISHDEKKSS